MIKSKRKKCGPGGELSPERPRSSRLEKLSNIAVIVAALVFSIVLVKNHLLAPAPSDTSRFPAISTLKGKKLNHPTLNGATSGPSIVLALSTQCGFCTQSMPFYRKLHGLRLGSGGNFRMITVFPQDTTVAEGYLRDNDFVPDTILSVPLVTIGVESTPTLLLVDSEGYVQEAWVGMLTEPDQKQVLSELKQICPLCSVPDAS